MHTFGASAPLKDRQKKFGFEPDQIVAVPKDLLRKKSAVRHPRRICMDTVSLPAAEFQPRMTPASLAGCACGYKANVLCPISSVVLVATADTEKSARPPAVD